MDRRLRRDVAWNVVPVALLGAVGLGINFLVAKWWGPAALGVFNLVTIAYFASAVVGAFGLQYAVLRAVAADEERGPIVIGALVPNLGFAALTTAAFLALRVPASRLLGEDGIAEGMLYAAPGLACFSINKVLLGVVNGMRRMRAYAVYTSLRYILIAAGVGLARSLDVAPDHLAGIWSFSEGVLLVVLAIEVIATVPLRAAGWRRWARDHVAYGARGVAATLAYEVNTKLDVWMLGAFHLRAETIGIYSLAAALNEGAMQLAVVVANNLNPIVARELAAGRPDEVVALARRTRRWFVPAFAAACALGAVLFPFVIPAVLPPEFAAGAKPFAILMAGLALASPYLPFAQIMLMANRPEWHTVLVVLVAAINVAIDCVLIGPLGVYGAALGMAGATVCTAVLVRRLARARAAVQI